MKENRLTIGQETWIITSILGLAFLIRFFLFATIQVVEPRFIYNEDTIGYIRTAGGLIQEGIFGRVGPLGEIEIDTTRTPGYSVLIALTMLLSKASYPLLLPILQISLNTLATFFLIGLVAKIVDFKVAVLAGIFFAVDPLSNLFSSMLLTESLFQSCLIVFLFFAVEYLSTFRLRNLFISGLLLACMAFIRPISFYLFIFVALGFLVYGLVKREKKAHVTLSHVVLLIVIAYGPLLLWQIRNQAHTGYFGFSTIASANLYGYNAASIMARKEGVSFPDKQREIKMIQEKEITSYPSAQAYYEHMKKEGIGIIKENPLLYASIHVEGMLRVLFSPSIDSLLRLDPSFGSWWNKQRALFSTDKLEFLQGWAARPYTAISLFIESAYLLAAAISLLFFIGNRDIAAVIRLFMVGVFLYFLILSGGIIGYDRFRIPLVPIYCITLSLFIFNMGVFLRSKFSSTLSHCG